MAAAAVAVSAPGKVLLAGGYLVLDRRHRGLVFALDARVSVVVAPDAAPGRAPDELRVESPQFAAARWAYRWRRRPADGGILVAPQHPRGDDAATDGNPFVETTLNYALSYVDAVAPGGIPALGPARIVILADNDYYSQPSVSVGRFARFPVALSAAHKTGLGSSAALVSALAAAVVRFFLPPALVDLASAPGKQLLHNLAQAAHCAAQGKIGSGFDVAAAVYGSCIYRRFSPDLLAQLPDPGSAGFARQLAGLVDGGPSAGWDAEIENEQLGMPRQLVLRMCDVDCGSQTVGMVKDVLAWRARNPDSAKRLWDELQARNDDLASALRLGLIDQLPDCIAAVREQMRQMGRLSSVPIEPPAQTSLLDFLGTVDGCYGGLVPGAGGFDALVLVTDDKAETELRLGEQLARWSESHQHRARLLGVKSEMEGLRCEEVRQFADWL